MLVRFEIWLLTLLKLKIRKLNENSHCSIFFHFDFVLWKPTELTITKCNGLVRYAEHKTSLQFHKGGSFYLVRPLQYQLQIMLCSGLKTTVGATFSHIFGPTACTKINTDCYLMEYIFILYMVSSTLVILAYKVVQLHKWKPCIQFTVTVHKYRMLL